MRKIHYDRPDIELTYFWSREDILEDPTGNGDVVNLGSEGETDIDFDQLMGGE